MSSPIAERSRWWMLNLARPYLANHFIDKGKWFLIDHLNPKPGQSLASLGTRIARTRYGWDISVDMAHTGHRALYLCGEYEIHISRLLASILNQKWQFVDVGANIGFYSLLAAGMAKRVWSFEPNQSTRELLTANVARNAFTNVTILPYGLSDEATNLSMHQNGNDIGGASLRTLAEDSREFEVPVVRGDSILEATDDGPTLVKIDVEGWEHRAMRGLEKFVSKADCAVVSEITDQWLKQTGSSALEYFDFMRSLGFHAYEIYSPPTAVRTHTKIRKLAAPLPDFQYDVLFTRAPTETAFYDWVDKVSR